MDYDYEDIYQYEMEIEQDIQEVRKTKQKRSYIETISPYMEDDCGYDILLQEGNQSEIEASILSSPQLAYIRLARLFNTILNLISFQDAEAQNSLSKYLENFFVVKHLIEYSPECQPHKQIGIYLDIDKNNVETLITNLMSQRNTLLQRLFIFMLNPSIPFISKMPDSCQYVLNKMEYLLFEDSDFYKNPNKLDILGLCFYADPDGNQVKFKFLAEIISKYLERYLYIILQNKKNSFLDSDQYKDDNKMSLVNLIQLVMALTTNKDILRMLHKDNFHNILYKSLRNCDPVLMNNKADRGWAKEKIILQSIVNLIIRIVSSSLQDKNFCEKLFADFRFLIQKQKLDFITNVILPIINAEDTQYRPVCFHPRVNEQRMKELALETLKSQSDEIQFTGSLQSSILQYQQVQILQQNVMDIISNVEKQQEQQQDQWQQLQNSMPFQQQQQMVQNMEIERGNVKGNWKTVLQFNTRNPVINFNLIKENLKSAQNALFVFEIMSGYEQVIIVVYCDGIQGEDKHYQFIQCKSNQKSFFTLFVQDQVWNVKAEDPAQYVLLDLQVSFLNLQYKQQKVALINLQDINQSQFGFPLDQVKHNGLLKDQLLASFNSEEVFLIGLEIFTFDQNEENPQDQVIKSLSNKSYKEQINYYLSKLRLNKIYLVPQNTTDNDIAAGIGQEIKNKEIDFITDYFVQQEVQQLNLNQKFERHLLNYFTSSSGGIANLAELLKINLIKGQQNQGRLKQDFYDDLDILLRLPEFCYHLSQEDGLLQYMLAIAFVQNKDCEYQYYHEGLKRIYNALLNTLKIAAQGTLEDCFYKGIFQLILQRIQMYHGLQGNKQIQQIQQIIQPKSFLLQKKQLPPPKQGGKPKGIGYGDAQYGEGNQFIQKHVKQQQPQNNEVLHKGYLETQSDYRSTNTSILVNCIIQLLRIDFNQEIFNNFIGIMKIFQEYFCSLSVANIEQDKEVQIMLQFLESISQVENGLALLSQNENFYRVLEGLQKQCIIYSKTFNVLDPNVKKFLDIFDYLECSLYAAGILKVEYEQEKQQQDFQNLKVHQFYKILMKNLAVGKTNVMDQAEFKAKMGACLAQCSNNPPAAKMQKILNEITTIDENLPMEATNSIFIRYDTTRMDCMRTLIIGASGTPYAHGAFLYEMLFTDEYPKRPPKVLLSTTGHGKVRFNPNLYNCGKVCLSLLGTWGDNWIADFSTILQILVSIQSMVMSEYVMFNEPGWESQMGTPDGETKNRGYCNFVKIQNIRYAMIEQLQNPPKGFEDIIKKSFFLRKELICQEIEQWIKDADLPVVYTQCQNNCIYQTKPQQYKTDLQQIYEELKVELNKLNLNLGEDFVQIQTSNRRTNIIKQNFQQVKKEKVKSNLPQGLPLDVDVSYENNIEQRAFDPNDVKVQNLMSRYIGVLGVDAIQSQSQATVLVSTLNALGIEIAKNIVLSGVKKLVIHDDNIVSAQDLCGQFYLEQSDIGKKISLASVNKLRNLNPYVIVEVLEGQLKNQNLNYNVIVTQDPYFAKTIPRPTYVVLAQCRGIFCRIITDFGDNFIITDKDGEAPSEVKIEEISQNVVTLQKGQHNIQEGDYVLFQEIQERELGGRSLNGASFQVFNVKQNSFQIQNMGYNQHLQGGIGIQQKQRITMNFKPIKEVLQSLNSYAPNMGLYMDADLVKRDVIHQLLNYPPQDEAWTQQSFTQQLELASQIQIKEQIYNNYKENIFEKYQDELLPLICLLGIQSEIPALCAYVGGLASQEVIKAITRKYTPIGLWVDWREDLLPYKLKEIQIKDKKILIQELVNKYNFIGGQQKYKNQEIILGDLYSLRQAKLFVVGAGAIGCELVKNIAMTGICTEGQLFITDPDIIENSNLNRQFLFREKHIRKAKSITAACAAVAMNPQLRGRIVARLDRVGQETLDIYHDNFYKSVHLVANALDNVQARLFVDQMCVKNETNLIESGTLGPKGHVQVIVPNETENYGNRQDPDQNNDIPYCTLKMFPENQLHCLEWGRDKFEQYFVRKPQALQAILSQDLSQMQQQTLELGLKVLKKLPINFDDCVTYARIKFEKLFSNSIQALLQAYPIDSKTKEGKQFWSAPKRPPNPIQFQGPWAIKFVEDFSILQAQCYGIQIPEFYNLQEMLQRIIVPEFQISKEKLQQMKEQVDKQNYKQVEEVVKNSQDIVNEIQRLLIQRKPQLPNIQSFEKDDDNNHHVSFVAAATNGRALCYSIPQVDWLWVKLKAGRIIPAMATTTSCISALQTIEIMKILLGIKAYRNSFSNLAIPFVMLSEPGECEKIKINDISISVWTKCTLNVKKQQEPVQYIVKRIEEKFNSQVLSIQSGVQTIYVLQMIPKDEKDRFEYLNTGINKYMELNSDIDVRLLFQGKEFTVKIKLTI